MEKAVRRGKMKKVIAFLVTFMMAFSLIPITAVERVEAAATNAPATEKNLYDNGDGTYTLSLSVTGAKSSSSSTQVSKANVVLVLDTSSSMTWGSGTTSDVTYTAVDGTPSDHDGTYYGTDDEGGYFRVYWRSSAWRVDNHSSSAVYSGTFYTREGGDSLSRIEALQNALTKDDGIIDNLLAQNVAGDANKSDIIEVAIVDFNATATQRQDFTTSAETLKTTVNNLGTATGTNWEDGLVKAKDYADTISGADEQPDEPVYVIFLTDGVPTESSSGTAYSTSGHWDYAKDNARDIVTAGYTFYGLFTWGGSNDVHYLSSLVQYAYTGSGDSNTELSSAYEKYYTDASDTDTLIAALNQIVTDITEAVGYTNVGLTDGVTAMTSSSVKASVSGSVSGIRYYRSGGSYGTADPDNGNYGTEWADAPEATINAKGEVDWKLVDEDNNPLTLEDGVTYTVAFAVWPSQDAVDLVADLNNGIIQYKDLTDTQKAQIVESGGTYTLKTNTDYPTVTYSTVTTTTINGSTTTVTSDPVTVNIENPEPVGITEAKLNALKSWEDSLDTSQREEVSSVVLYLLQDGDYYYLDEDNKPLGVTLTEESDWTKTNYVTVAPGLMVSSDSAAYDADATQVTWNSKKYAILEEGHEYIFEEDDINNHFELTAYTHHPMLIDNELYDVTFTKNTSGEITGIESAAPMSTTISATNTLKPGINIQKKVVDATGAEINSTDPFKVTVYLCDETGAVLPTKTASDNTEYTIDYRIYYGANNPNYDAASGGGRSGHIYKTGTSFTETLYVGDVIRVVNVEAGALFRVEETESTGYELTSTTYEISEGSTSAYEAYDSADAVALSGKTYYPTVGNAASQATLTNTYTYGSLEVSKTVAVTSGDSAQAKAKEFEFAFKLYSDNKKTTELTGLKYGYTKTAANGTKTTGTITEGGTFKLKDGEKFVIEKLPEGSYYEVTETAATGYVTTVGTTETTAASGTIAKDTTASAAFTNTYSASSVIVDPPVKKDITGTEALYNGGDFTFTIANTAAPNGVTAPMPTYTSITNSSTYELTDKKGYYEFGNIEFTVPGTYTYTVTESGSAVGVTNDSEATKTITFTVADNSQGALTVTPTTDNAVFSFTNAYKTGELDISKTVVNSLNASDTTKFTFTVTLKDASGTALTGSFPYTIGETSGTIASGGTLQLANGETAKITGIPEGASYEVTETAAAGYTITSKSGDTGTISSAAATAASFTNTYSVTAAGISPAVKKDITGNEDLYNGGDFTFTIANTAAPEGVTAPMPASTSITNSEENEITGKTGYYEFGTMQFTVPGTYTYAVTESGSVLGVTNDSEATKTITFTVADNKQGGLTITPTGDNAVFSFTNAYKTGELDISKTVVNSLNASDTTKFTFTVTLKDASGTALTGNFPYTIGETSGTIASGGTLQLANGETAKITGIPEGASYEVTETAAAGYTITSKSGDTGTISSETAAAALFTNTYNVQPVKASFTVQKVLSVPDGLTGPSAWSYDVAVTAGDSAYPAAEAMSGTITNETENSALTFGSFEFTAPGEYTYTVTESGTVAGVTNDKNAQTGKTVTFNVTDNKNGTMSVTTVGSPVVFTNTYSAAGTAYIDVTKEMSVPEGLTGPDSWEYVFEVTADNSTYPVPDTAAQTISSKAPTASFGPFSYTKTGTYTYTVSEKGLLDGVTNDTESSKAVTIDVIDNGDGTLTATVNKTADRGKVKFTNTYDAASTTAVITAKKTISGYSGEDADGTFTLVLSDSEGNQVDSKQVTTSGGTGTVEFKAIEYTKPGEYNYTITETQDSEQTGYKYDETAYKVTVTVTDNQKGKLVAVVTTEDGNEVTNKYVKGAEVVLKLTKVVEDTAGSAFGSDGTEEKVFTFTLKSADESDGFVPQTKTATLTADAPTAEVEFDKITYEYPASETYNYIIEETVAEGSEEAGWTYDTTEYPVVVKVTEKTVTAESGDTYELDTEVTYKVEETDQTELTITNTYDPEDADAQLSAQKVVDDQSDSAPDEIFTFTITDGNGYKETVTRTNGGAVTFSKLIFAKVGTYTYKIKETAGSTSGYTYDASEYTATVNVTDDGSGKLSAAVEYDKTPVFTNPYKAEPTSVTFSVEKALTGMNEGVTPAVFKFRLADGEDNEIQTVSVQGSGSAAFNTINYEKAGTYTYTISEVNEGAGGYTYDSARYELKVDVTDKAGALSADTSITKIAEDGSKTEASEIVFNNSYSTTNAEVVLNGTKTLTGRDLQDGEFSFTAESSDGQTKTAVNAADGSIAFESFLFSKPGTYTISVTEDAGTLTGVTYDTTEYTVDVTVTDNGDGTLSAAVEGGDAITFTNTYVAPEPEEITVVLHATKVLTGKTLTAGEFSFTVSQGETVYATGTNDASGNIVFSEITLSAAGTYKFIVKEVAGIDASMTYDTSEYTVTVVVTDDEAGKLVVSSVEGEELAVFNNKYTATTCTPKKTTTNTRTTAKTGDTGNAGAWAGILAASLVLLAGFGIAAFRRRRS